jgi:hypothetical protein
MLRGQGGLTLNDVMIMKSAGSFSPTGGIFVAGVGNKVLLA